MTSSPKGTTSTAATPTRPTSANSEDWTQNPALEASLDDVHTRFLLNLPSSELATADRIFFQLEQAWWFYEDMICDAMVIPDSNASSGTGSTNSNLPRFSNLKPFAKLLFEFSPLFPDKEIFANMWHQFSLYKKKISTYGTILVNKAGTHIILCKTWTGGTWTFPAGKINQGESGIEAAARETFEETGFDPHCQFGITKEWLESSPENIAWKHPLPEGKSAFAYQEPSSGKRRTCYVCHGVPDDFEFAPVARKEVSEIQWFPIDLNSKDNDTGLPKKTFAVLPFLGRLKSWIRRNVRKTSNSSHPKSRPKSNGRDKSRSKRGSGGGGGGKTNASNSHDPLVTAGLVQEGEQTRWTEEEMFKANEQLIGKKVDYDGNPYVFSEQGFQGNDPHAFRVVGGSFMNASSEQGSSEDNKLTDKKKLQYQPLVRSEDPSEAGLKPFFSSEGATPWGEVCKDVKNDIGTTATSKNKSKKQGKQKNKGLPVLPTQQQVLGQALLSKLHAGSSSFAASGGGDDDDDGPPPDILTDAQITRKSQQGKLRHQKYLEDTQFIKDWVNKLPQPKQYRIHVNIDDILNQL